jgi:hypothetical protein
MATGDMTGSSSNPASTSYASGGPESQTAKRRAHYRIEKRYRTNINDKIRALDEMLPKASPADRQWADQQEGGGEDGGYQGDGANIKRSKGEVLSRAIDYIVFLKGKDAWQEKRIQELKGRMRASRKALEL